jgi:spore maturation protein CgeB
MSLTFLLVYARCLLAVHDRPSDLTVIIFGTAISSAYLSGATMLFRSFVAAFARQGWRIVFIEETHAPSDYVAPDGLTVCQYHDRESLMELLNDPTRFHSASLVLKFSGSSIEHDRFIDEWLTVRKQAKREPWTLLYVDADAPMRLPYIVSHAGFYLRSILPAFDSVWVMLGGQRATQEYMAMGARHAFTLPAAIDVGLMEATGTTQSEPVDLLFVGNPTLGRAVALQSWFFDIAEIRPQMRFVLAGAEWEFVRRPRNVRVLGYVPSQELPTLYGGARLVLNVTREEMAVYGDAASLRLFEAAACGACIVTDAWRGLERLFVSGEEIVVAKAAVDVMNSLDRIGWAAANSIGRRARARVLADHTSDVRIEELLTIVESIRGGDRPLN